MHHPRPVIERPYLGCSQPGHLVDPVAIELLAIENPSVAVAVELQVDVTGYRGRGKGGKRS